jgi:hypothetical protein
MKNSLFVPQPRSSCWKQGGHTPLRLYSLDASIAKLKKGSLIFIGVINVARHSLHNLRRWRFHPTTLPPRSRRHGRRRIPIVKACIIDVPPPPPPPPPPPDAAAPCQNIFVVLVPVPRASVVPTDARPRRRRQRRRRRRPPGG